MRQWTFLARRKRSSLPSLVNISSFPVTKHILLIYKIKEGEEEEEGDESYPRLDIEEEDEDDEEELEEMDQEEGEESPSHRKTGDDEGFVIFPSRTGGTYLEEEEGTPIITFYFLTLQIKAYFLRERGI